jgi:hypothetical protein
MTDGYVVSALGAIVLAAVFVARRWPFVLPLAGTFAAAVGFLIRAIATATAETTRAARETWTT